MKTYRSRGRARRARGLTEAQQRAHDAAWAAREGTVEGRYTRGEVVAGADGQCWRISTYGVRYHEDVSTRLYGVLRARAPKGYTETIEIRLGIEEIRSNGTHEPGSRGGTAETQVTRPGGAKVAMWRDAKPGSLASFPELTVYEGGVVGVWCPIYDDAPVVAWVQDPRRAARLLACISKVPQPVHLVVARIKLRAHLEVAAALAAHS